MEYVRTLNPFLPFEPIHDPVRLANSDMGGI